MFVYAGIVIILLLKISNITLTIHSISLHPLQRLCELVCDLLLEESNVQPVYTPVTICGDIHGQVRPHPLTFFFILVLFSSKCLKSKFIEKVCFQKFFKF